MRNKKLKYKKGKNEKEKSIENKDNKDFNKTEREK